MSCRVRLLCALWLSAPAFGVPPNFECKDGLGAKYQVWLSPQRNALVMENGLGKREYLLSEPNLRAAVPNESPLYYVGLTEKGKTDYSRYQMGTMVRTDFYLSAGKSFASVDIVLDHRPVPGLVCQTPQLQVPTTPAAEHTPLAKRAAEPLLKWGGHIDRDGILDPLSLLAAEASVLQLYNSEKAQDTATLDQFTRLTGATLKQMPITAVDTLKRRLTAKEREFLDSLLDLCGYRTYPEVQRFADWVAQGLSEKKPDLVHAGLHSFFISKAFTGTDLRAFFEGELKKTIPQLEPYSIVEMTDGFAADREAFILKVWNSPRKAEYGVLKSAYPYLIAMERNLTRARMPEEGPTRSQFSSFAAAFSSLIRLPSFGEPSLQSHLRTRILPLVNRMSPKERNNLGETLPELEKSALETLRKKKGA